MKTFKDLLNEKKLDKVGKEDADIDNDGDVDDSDEYLKKRREAISKNMKEEAELEFSESFFAGEFKLASGEKVTLTSKDHSLLANFFGDLEIPNKRKMMKILKKDKKSFLEVLGLAREVK